MPLPMVLATAVPSRKAAKKLKNAAQATASLGDNTRVETTVAMLLAASWNPFRKSNVNAAMTVIVTSISAVSTSLGPRVSREHRAAGYQALLTTTASSTLAASSALSVAISSTS